MQRTISYLVEKSDRPTKYDEERVGRGERCQRSEQLETTDEVTTRNTCPGDSYHGNVKAHEKQQFSTVLIR